MSELVGYHLIVTANHQTYASIVVQVLFYKTGEGRGAYLVWRRLIYDLADGKMHFLHNAYMIKS